MCVRLTKSDTTVQWLNFYRVLLHACTSDRQESADDERNKDILFYTSYKYVNMQIFYLALT